MNRLTVRDIDVSGKRVLVRVDFNVPLNDDTGIIRDDSRIKASLPTIRYLIDNGAKVILCTHMGRPKGKVVESMRVSTVAGRLSELLGSKVITTSDCIGPEAEQAITDMGDNTVVLLENLRFHSEEESNEQEFAKSLASLADIYVDDAFGTAHRNHASIVGVTKHLPSVAGLLMEKELIYLGEIIGQPARPFGGIFGGVKVSDKLIMLDNVIPRVDFALIGGSMVATFLKAKSYDVGTSIYEEDQIATAVKMMADAASNESEVVLPLDVVVAEELNPYAKAIIVPIDKIPNNQKILDIGPETTERFCETLKTCKTIFWNGPLGVNEIPQFAQGTLKVAEFLAGYDATIVIGGGSTSDVITNLGLAEKMTFVSTGGGASLRFLGGNKLPGVEALLTKDSALKNSPGLV